MIQKKDSSKVFIIGTFFLLITIFLAVAIIYEKNKKENNRIIRINLDTNIEETLNWKFSTKTNFIEAKIGRKLSKKILFWPFLIQIYSF